MVSTIRPQLFRLPLPVESPFQSTRLQKLPLPCTGTHHRTDESDCYRSNRIYIISYPTVHSPLYTTPVTVNDKSDFRAITVVNPRHYSLPIYFAPDYSGYKQYGEYTAEWKPLNVQPYLTPWRFECTGKISGNGTYTVSFIYTKGETPFRLGTLKLYKRDELLAEVPQSVLINANSPIATYRFTVDSFEAGTPFFIEVEACGEKGNDTSGLVFINKVTQ